MVDVVSSPNDLLTHLQQVVAQLEAVLPQAGAIPVQQSPALTPEQFDSLIASW